jgi:hypothetical protein
VVVFSFVSGMSKRFFLKKEAKTFIRLLRSERRWAVTRCRQ